MCGISHQARIEFDAARLDFRSRAEQQIGHRRMIGRPGEHPGGEWIEEEHFRDGRKHQTGPAIERQKGAVETDEKARRDGAVETEPRENRGAGGMSNDDFRFQAKAPDQGGDRTWPFRAARNPACARAAVNPCPGKSGATTRKCCASKGARSRHEWVAPPVPWSSRRSGTLAHDLNMPIQTARLNETA